MKKRSILSEGKAFFSFNGTLGRLGFLGTLLLINFILSVLLYPNSMVLNFLGYLLMLYLGTAAMQKRWRDIGLKGTIGILIYYVFVLLKSCFDYFQKADIVLDEIWTFLLLFVTVIYFLLLAFLLVVSGVKDKNQNLISPILKNPRIYISVGFFILLLSRYALMLYYQ